jgi:hypothetical protein
MGESIAQARAVLADILVDLTHAPSFVFLINDATHYHKEFALCNRLGMLPKHYEALLVSANLATIDINDKLLGIICNVIIHVWMSVSFNGSCIKPTFGEKIFSNESEVLFHFIHLSTSFACVVCCERRHISQIITPMSAHRGHLLKPILLPHQYKTRNYMI